MVRTSLSVPNGQRRGRPVAGQATCVHILAIECTPYTRSFSIRKFGDGQWYVGPGNGLFELVQRRAEWGRLFSILGRAAWLPQGQQHSALPRCGARLLRDRSLPDRAHVLTHALIVAHPLHEKAVPDTNGIAPPMHKDLNLTEGAQRDDVVGLDQNRSRVHQGTGQSVEGKFSSEGSSKTAKYNGRGSASRQ